MSERAREKKASKTAIAGRRRLQMRKLLWLFNIGAKAGAAMIAETAGTAAAAASAAAYTAGISLARRMR